MTSTEEKFWVARGEHKKGPLSKPQVVKNILNGNISETDLIYCAAYEEWLTATDTEFASTFKKKYIKIRENIPIDQTNLWCSYANVWLMILGAAFVFDQLVVVKDNPFGGIRPFIFYPWFLFSITSNVFLYVAMSIENALVKHHMTRTAIIILVTIWCCLSVQVFWGIKSGFEQALNKQSIQKNFDEFR